MVEVAGRPADGRWVFTVEGIRKGREGGRRSMVMEDINSCYGALGHW